MAVRMSSSIIAGLLHCLLTLLLAPAGPVNAQYTLPDTQVDAGEHVHCSGAVFGKPITPPDVEAAAMSMPRETYDVQYLARPIGGPWSLPLRYRSPDGKFTITVEAVGERAYNFTFPPNAIRRAVGWIKSTCAINSEGGFATLGRAAHMDYYLISGQYARESRASLAGYGGWRYGSGGGFLGISVTRRQEESTNFGNMYNTVWDGFVWELISNGWNTKLTTKAAARITREAQDYRRALHNMPGSGWERYHRSVAKINNMPHQCDATRFGVPKEQSCRHLLLETPGDELVNLTTAYSSMKSPDGCEIRMRAESPGAVVWERIRTIAEALLSVCMDSPRSGGGGGVADGSTLFAGNSYNGVHSADELIPPGITVQVANFPVVGP